jgi:pyrimidine operon attenuation protein/uracil phosphoribosyltransferase
MDKWGSPLWALLSEGRKVRAAQSKMTANGRPSKPSKAQALEHKARNRATETSVLSYGETR